MYKEKSVSFPSFKKEELFILVSFCSTVLTNGSPPAQRFIKVQHGNVGKVRNPSNRFQEPKALNRTTIKEIVEKEASHVVESQTDRVRIDSTAIFDTTAFRLGDFKVGKRQIQTKRRLLRVDLLDPHNESNLIQNGGTLTLKILSGQVPRAVGLGPIVAVFAGREFRVKEVPGISVRVGFRLVCFVKKRGKSVVAMDRNKARTERRKRSN